MTRFSPPAADRRDAAAAGNLVIVLGDQLNHDSTAFADLDPARDVVWMAENQNEATHVWCHRYRLVAFFAPMRHFRDELIARGWEVLYHELPRDGRQARVSSFTSVLNDTASRRRFAKWIVVQPGDHRVQSELRAAAARHGVELEVRQDDHFYCSPDRFAAWAEGRRSLVLESFYRVMRAEHAVLMDGKQPVGDQWNFDHDNRGSFGKQGPRDVPAAPSFPADRTTCEVIEMVRHRFADHPGEVDAASFDLAVTRTQAVASLQDFVTHRLNDFGKYQDAMWSGQTFLYHSRLSHAINLHLLSPREVVDAAVAAYHDGSATLSSVEGFVRQILGWREFVRGIYWLKMPEYETRNSLGCDEDQDVPEFFWDGRTEMACVADAMRLLLATAYAHHIQRLMVLGLFAQLHGTHPLKFHQWHMAMYADAIDWVSLPNALGMSQYGDGGLMATKPYCATGKYIKRMSNHCQACRYDPDRAVGDDACPFTTLYWDFLDRHGDRFRGNHRMVMQLKNVDRKDAATMDAIRQRAAKIRDGRIRV